jgi:hypothetical protein
MERFPLASLLARRVLAPFAGKMKGLPDQATAPPLTPIKATFDEGAFLENALFVQA